MTREYIIETCKEYGIENYTINDDLSIDVKGSVNLSNKGLTELPLIFNIIEGDFYCNNNKLTNLKGSPRKCEDFYCFNNDLTNLEGAPDECDDFDCFNNINLATLKGAPICNYITMEYKKLNLDSEELYVIEAIANWFDFDEGLKNYLRIRNRNNAINLILND